MGLQPNTPICSLVMPSLCEHWNRIFPNTCFPGTCISRDSQTEMLRQFEKKKGSCYDMVCPLFRPGASGLRDFELGTKSAREYRYFPNQHPAKFSMPNQPQTPNKLVKFCTWVETGSIGRGRGVVKGGGGLFEWLMPPGRPPPWEQ